MCVITTFSPKTGLADWQHPRITSDSEQKCAWAHWAWRPWHCQWHCGPLPPDKIKDIKGLKATHLVCLRVKLVTRVTRHKMTQVHYSSLLCILVLWHLLDSITLNVLLACASFLITAIRGLLLLEISGCHAFAWSAGDHGSKSKVDCRSTAKLRALCRSLQEIPTAERRSAIPPFWRYRILQKTLRRQPLNGDFHETNTPRPDLFSPSQTHHGPLSGLWTFQNAAACKSQRFESTQLRLLKFCVRDRLPQFE